jgi:hypothetical protein
MQIGNMNDSSHEIYKLRNDYRYIGMASASLQRRSKAKAE